MEFKMPMEVKTAKRIAKYLLVGGLIGFFLFMSFRDAEAGEPINPELLAGNWAVATFGNGVEINFIQCSTGVDFSPTLCYLNAAQKAGIFVGDLVEGYTFAELSRIIPSVNRMIAARVFEMTKGIALPTPLLTMSLFLAGEEEENPVLISGATEFFAPWNHALFKASSLVYPKSRGLLDMSLELKGGPEDFVEIFFDSQTSGEMGFFLRLGPNGELVGPPDNDFIEMQQLTCLGCL